MLTVTRSFIVSVRRCTGFRSRTPDIGILNPADLVSLAIISARKKESATEIHEKISLSMEKLGLRILIAMSDERKSRIILILVYRGAEGNSKMSAATIRN